MNIGQIVCGISFGWCLCHLWHAIFYYKNPLLIICQTVVSFIVGITLCCSFY
jgi:hypothetical protein